MIPMALLLLLVKAINAQNIVKGIVVDYNSEKPLKNVSITIKNNSTQLLETNDLGVFILKKLGNGNTILELNLPGYETQNFQLDLIGTTIDLGIIFLYPTIYGEEDFSTITLTDDELNDDTNSADNISGLLQSSKDIYLRTAAFEFSSSFFRVRGLDSENGKVLINGIEMNKV